MLFSSTRNDSFWVVMNPSLRPTMRLDLLYTDTAPKSGASILRTLDSRITEMSLSLAAPRQIRYTTAVEYTPEMINEDRGLVLDFLEKHGKIAGSHAKAHYLMVMYNDSPIATLAPTKPHMSMDDAKQILRNMGHNLNDHDYVVYEHLLTEEVALAMRRLDLLYCQNDLTYDYMVDKPLFIELGDVRHDIFVVPKREDTISTTLDNDYVPFEMVMQSAFKFNRPKDRAYYMLASELYAFMSTNLQCYDADVLERFPQVSRLDITLQMHGTYTNLVTHEI